MNYKVGVRGDRYVSRVDSSARLEQRVRNYATEQRDNALPDTLFHFIVVQRYKYKFRYIYQQLGLFNNLRMVSQFVKNLRICKKISNQRIRNFSN